MSDMAEGMVERVTRALFATMMKGHLEEHRDKDMFKDLARAAIEAMREPTPEMLAPEDVASSWQNCPTCGGIRRGWEAMIDAALTPPAVKPE